jgi:hypothetical protein
LNISGQYQNPPLPLSESELLTLIPKLAKQGNIKLSSHAQLRLNQPDRSMTYDRLLFILKRPKEITIQWDEKHKQYKYKVQSFNNRHCVVNLEVENTYIKVVTVF